jgi:hypothetical protein
MRVQFTKRNDGGVVTQFFRSDGSTTWRRYDKHGVFFSYHDLTHFAVECSLLAYLFDTLAGALHISLGGLSFRCDGLQLHVGFAEF